MLHFLFNFTLFIITLGVLIIVHEFGHFWMAYRCGVMVKRFSIGFGRVLWRWFDKLGTEYVIAIIPLGGYIKMLDTRVDIVASEHRHKAFNHKTVWQRAAIITAGSIFNFFFAIFAYWLVFLIGVPSYRPVIGEVIPHSIASRAEIFPGMELKSIDGIETPDWDTARLEIINKISNSKIILGVVSPDSKIVEQKMLDLRKQQFELSKQDIIIELGIIPLHPCTESVLIEIQPGSAAMKAGLQAGDKIVKVDGHPVTSWQFFVNCIRNNPGKPVWIGIDRHGEIRNVLLRPDSKPLNKGGVKGFIGVLPKTIPLPEKYKIVRRYSLLPALAQASEKTWQLMQLTVNTLGKLIIGSVRLNSLSGPISIAQNAGASAKYGFIYYLMFLALISVNLGIINLFPLPVLDGGHLFFLVIEKLRGVAVSEQVQDFSYRIGSILLMLLMGLAFLNDLSRL